MNTINNTQVDCTNLTMDQVYELSVGLKLWDNTWAMRRSVYECYFSKFESDDEFYIRSKSESKTTVSFDEFLNLKKL